MLNFYRLMQPPLAFLTKVSTLSLLETLYGIYPIQSPLTVNGKTQHLVGMTHHYSWSKLFGLTTHGAVNDLTPNVGDPNSQTPEYKAFLVNIEKTTV